MYVTTNCLRKFSIAYLLLPNLLFSFGWFRLPISIFLIIGLSYLFYLELRKSESGVILFGKDIFYLVALAGVLTFFCGIHGFTEQSYDWLAHNGKYYDLFKNHWPIYFPEVKSFACYYFGYYLVPAFISKMFGELLPGVFIIWTMIGFFFGLAWILILLDKNRIMLIPLLFVKGVEQFGFAAIMMFKPEFAVKIAFDPSLRSIFEQITFVPNQVIPAMIGAGILIYDYVNCKMLDQSFFVITLIFIWSVFPGLSLLAIFAALAIHRYVIQKQWSKLTPYIIINSYLIPGLLFLPVFVYFLSTQSNLYQGFIWNYRPFGIIVTRYLSGIFISSLIAYAMLRLLNRQEKYLPMWLINVLFLELMALSFYRLGLFNDSFFRGSIPFCLILYTIFFRGIGVWLNGITFYQKSVKYIPGIGAVALLLLIFFGKSSRLRNNVAFEYLSGKSVNREIRYDAFPNTYRVLMDGYQDGEARQYIGAENSFYAKYLSGTNTSN